VPGVDVGAVFAALADPTRREVVRSLAERPGLTASLLAGELPMTRQAVAKHLSALSVAGLVTARREGRETRYTLTPAPLAEAIDWMAGVGAAWDSRLARLAKRA
jgi:DNA-binding transcriptional ArsR family regulator